MGEVYRARDAKLGRQVAIKVLGVEALANPGALRRFQARSAGGVRAESPGHRHDPRPRGARRPVLHRDGARRRHDPPAAAAARTAAAEEDPSDRQPARRCARQGARGRHRPLRSEARERHAHRRGPRQDRGLRAGEAGRARGRSHPPIERPGIGRPSACCSEPSATCRRSRRAERAPTFAPTSSRSAPSCTSWRRAAVPSKRTTSAETLSMIIRGDPERPLALNPSLPLPLVWTIERCLSKDPADRYASTRDLARDLQTLRDHSGDWHGLDAPRLAPRIRRPRLLAAAVAIAAALGVAGTAVYFATRAGSERSSWDSARANLPAAHVQARPDTERALRAGRPDDHLCGRVGRRPGPPLRNASSGARVAADWTPVGRSRQHLLGWRSGADSELSARLGELRRHARQDADGRRRSTRSAGRRRQRGLDARRPGARRNPGNRRGVSDPVPARQVALRRRRASSIGWHSRLAAIGSPSSNTRFFPTNRARSRSSTSKGGRRRSRAAGEPFEEWIGHSGDEIWVTASDRGRRCSLYRCLARRRETTPVACAG